MNLACTQCHDQNWGKRLLTETISQGHGNAFPAYRLEWQALGSLQRRIRACLFGVRARNAAARRAGAHRRRALSRVARARACRSRRPACGDEAARSRRAGRAAAGLREYGSRAAAAGRCDDRDMRGDLPRSVVRAGPACRPTPARACCARTTAKCRHRARRRRPRRKYRLMFVPGFLASCFRGVHSFADVVEARAGGLHRRRPRRGRAQRHCLQREAHRRADRAHARDDIRAHHPDRPLEGRERASRGAGRRGPTSRRASTASSRSRARCKAARSRTTFRACMASRSAIMPFSRCDRGEGDPVARSHRRSTRRDGGRRTATRDARPSTRSSRCRISRACRCRCSAPYARLSSSTPDNDGMLRVQDQVVPVVAAARHRERGPPERRDSASEAFCIFWCRPGAVSASAGLPGSDRRDRRAASMTDLRITQLTGDEMSLAHRMGGGGRLGPGSRTMRRASRPRTRRASSPDGSTTSRSRRSRWSSTARRSRSSACTS